MANIMATSAGDSTWHLVLQRNKRLWRIIVAPIGCPIEGVNPFSGELFHTAKEARQMADKFFPNIAWVNSKKGYVKVTSE